MPRIDGYSTNYHLHMHVLGYAWEFRLQALVSSDHRSRYHRSAYDNSRCWIDIKMSDSYFACRRDFNVLEMSVIDIRKSDFRHDTGRHGHNILSQRGQIVLAFVRISGAVFSATRRAESTVAIQWISTSQSSTGRVYPLLLTLLRWSPRLSRLHGGEDCLGHLRVQHRDRLGQLLDLLAAGRRCGFAAQDQLEAGGEAGAGGGLGWDLGDGKGV